MGHWSNNPEKYDELVQQGILRWIDTIMQRHGFEVTGDWQEGYRALLETLHEAHETQDLYASIRHHARNSILSVEQDYWGGQVDAAKETLK